MISRAESPLDDNVSYNKLSGSFEMRDVTFGCSRLGAPFIEGARIFPAARGSAWRSPVFWRRI